MCNSFFWSIQKTLFWAPKWFPIFGLTIHDLDRESVAGNDKVQKNVIHALKIGI